MAIDIKNILEIVQRKVANVSASTSTADLQKLLNLAKRVDGSLMRTYDSDGSLPDAGSTTERMAYITSTGVVKFNNGRWDNLTGTALGVAGGGASGPSLLSPVTGYATGYSMTGWGPASAAITSIEEFSLTSDGNASSTTSVPFAGLAYAAGMTDGTYAYKAGGYQPSSTPYNNIFQVPYANTSTTSDVGNLTSARRSLTGNSSADNGYTSGGIGPSPGGVNIIDKMPFVSLGTMSDVGDLNAANWNSGDIGQNSHTYGYRPTGAGSSGYIQKFSFSSDGNATNVGTTVTAASSEGNAAAASSDVYGYISGKVSNPGVYTNIIEKFPFATDTNTTDIADTTVTRAYSSSVSSDVSGYVSGGWMSPGYANIIDKFPFAADANATDVGDLSIARYGGVGAQV